MDSLDSDILRGTVKWDLRQHGPADTQDVCLCASSNPSKTNERSTMVISVNMGELRRERCITCLINT